MKIAVLLSGGVDSSLALALLKEQGHDLTAWYLKIWLEDDASFLGECPWEEDLSYARQVCDKLDVPLKVMPLQQEYYKLVVGYTLEELKNGRTPSPDIFCNRLIKFGAFMDRVGDEYDKIASGHYARIVQDDDGVHLFRAPDPVKDQTYFLSRMKREQLSKILFPVGEYHKTRVRELAEEYDLPTKSRKDSQGICFLGKIKFRDFARMYLGEKQGNILELESGNCLGLHKGFWFYTIGQRTGLGLSGGPWYVVRKDIEKNIIYVSRTRGAEREARASFRVGSFNWIREPEAGERLSCKLRHGPQIYGCTLDREGDCGNVTLDDADRGIAAGQFSVFYSGEECLGCGTILG